MWAKCDLNVLSYAIITAQLCIHQQSIKAQLGNCFSMKDLGEATYILGIKIYRDRYKRLLSLSQSTYIDKVLNRFAM